MRDLMEFLHYNLFTPNNKYIVSQYRQTCDCVLDKVHSLTEGRLT